MDSSEAARGDAMRAIVGLPKLWEMGQLVKDRERLGIKKWELPTGLSGSYIERKARPSKLR